MMKRREFLKVSVAASAAMGLSCGESGGQAGGGANGSATQEYYELRVYRLKSNADRPLLDNYLSKALVPGLNRLGSRPVGVFTQQERAEAAAGTEARDPLAVTVLIPYPTLEAFAASGGGLAADAEYQRAGAEYLQATKANPAFERIESWLLLAFAAMPKVELPAYCREPKPRMFEVRCYESYSEVKALKKVEMFNTGETELMREVKLGPIFFGQALIGSRLPHLTYMLSAESPAAHKEHWDAFRAHPKWDQMKNDPQYADTVSKITNWFLVPTAYSQI